MIMTKNVKSTFLLLICTILTMLFFLQLFMPARIHGQSMVPTFTDDDHVLVGKFCFKNNLPHYDDLVIINFSTNKNANQLMIKRVVGLPGDHLEFKDNKLYRNGTLLEEHYLKEEMINQPNQNIIVLENEAFVLGDNRNHSIDSRHFGTVNIKEQIIGKVLLKIG